ncbi:MAG: exodeoxyribonuclease III [Erysipelotrichaceae bacterium]|nr:exodeoxyribonuclease III [Erysipelotrichaceae bacterium]
MKLISWNVNGLRACAKKGFFDFLNQEQPDIMALQETKMQRSQLEFDFPGYHLYMNDAEKKGYSGTLIITKQRPLNVSYDFKKEHPKEGRVITLEFEDFFFVDAYVPNSKDGLKRLDYRMMWEDDLRDHLSELDKIKPVIYCGDLNVAHNEIDLKNPDANHKNAGFSDEERNKFSELLAAGFIDSFRTLYPDKIQYSWWSYRTFARAKGIGWRIDYFVLSKRLQAQINDAIIYDSIEGSDHCPVGLLLK